MGFSNDSLHRIPEPGTWIFSLVGKVHPYYQHLLVHQTANWEKMGRMRLLGTGFNGGAGLMVDDLKGIFQSYQLCGSVFTSSAPRWASPALSTSQQWDTQQIFVWKSQRGYVLETKSATDGSSSGRRGDEKGIWYWRASTTTVSINTEIRK